MDIGEQTTGTWAPPAPETFVPGPDAWGYGDWPPPTGPPVTGRRRRPGWATAVVCILVGVVAVAGMAAVGFVLPEAHPSHWDARVAGLAAYVERQRGLEFRHPVPVDFLDDDAFVATVTTDEADLTEADRGDIEDDEAVARALGLAGTATDFVVAENTLSGEGILAFYDSEAKRITVRGTEMSVSLRITLVHELVHVLQDQHFDLSRRGSFATTAQDSAFDAVVEGDAVSIENLYYWSLPDAERAAYDAELDGQISDMQAGTAGVPGWMAAAAQAPYVLGEPFVTALVAARGPEAVDEALRRPPATEEQLMDVRRFLAGDKGRSLKTLRPADGDRVIEERDLGTLTWLFLLAERIPALDALAAADGWGGDAYLAFERDGQVCTRAAFVGDTAADTDEMARALDRWAADLPAGQASVRRSGAAVELLSCDPGREATPPTLSGAGSGPEVAMALLATRASTFAGALDGGSDEAEAGCLATGMLSEFSPDELAAPELPADFEARRGRLEERCR